MKKEIRVKIEAEKLNIKDYLERQGLFSSRRIKTLLKNKRVLINGKAAYWDNSVKNNDILTIDLSEAGKDSIAPEAIPIDVIYEDEYFLAVNKPAGLLVHPTKNHIKGTLANGIKHYFIKKGLEVPIRFANRIDMDTSGIVVAAKSGEAHAMLSEKFGEEGCEKYYMALAEGKFESKRGCINEPIGIDEENPIRRTVRNDGQRSITQYEVIEQYDLAALLRLKLITGRTHQIRVHLSSLGHPLLGDKLYEGKAELIARQALHACEMIFTHPFSHERIRLEAPLPDDLKKLIDKLKNFRRAQS